MDIQEIMQLIDKVSNSKLSEFVLEKGDTKLTLKAEQGKHVGLTSGIEQSQIEMQEVQQQVKQEVVTKPMAMPPVQAPMTEKDRQEKEKSVSGNMIKSPLVGTFYAAPSEDKPPFVVVGDTVKKGQVIGIVEAMKLMNEVESEFDGTVLEILVSNEEMVEYGQPLVVIG